MSEHIFLPAVVRGVYPTNYIAAVFDNLDDAQKAVEILCTVGFNMGDIILITSPQAIEIAENLAKHRKLFDRLRFAVANVVSDERPFQETYIQAAQHGSHILQVRTLINDEQQLAASIFKDHQGYTIKFFGQWTITDYF